MWVIFRKSDKEVVGVSADTKFDLAKDEALQEVIRGLVKTGDPKDFDAFQVKDRVQVAKVREKLRRLRGRKTIQKTPGGTGLEVVVEAESGSILVTTNATQLHPVDNVPLILGNGQSFLVVTLTKFDEEGKPLTRKTKDKDVNPREIRSVTLASGTANFRIYSENSKRLATVEMLTDNPELRLGGLQVEFT
jgi:hypothetical protein